MWHTSNPKKSKRRTSPPHRYGRITRCSEKREKGTKHQALMEYVMNSTKNMWDINKRELLNIINIMYLEGLMTQTQKHGHIFWLAKIGFPAQPKNNRSLTILKQTIKHSRGS